MCQGQAVQGLRRRSSFLKLTGDAIKGAVAAISDFNKLPAATPVFARRSLSDSALQQRDGPRSKQQVTLEELAQHNTPEDCWLVIKNKVYDVSGWGPQHPGGHVIYTYAGKDATDVFACFHAQTTWSQLRPFCIGDIVEEEPMPALLKDFRELRTRLQQQGLFRSNKLYYLYKVASTLSLLAAALAVLITQRDSWLGLVGGAFLLGLFWQQSGWLAHDFLHHQVFTDRQWNNVMGYFLGNVCQGFSTDWWKSKHNVHHAVPNELDSDSKAARDPDIDTLPLLAWSSEMLDSMSNSGARLFVRMQHYFFFPILLFARMSWCQQSVAHASDLSRTSKAGVYELAYLALHYAWFLGAAFSVLPPLKAVVFALLSQMFSGFLLSIVFVQSHNGMEVYSDTKDFVTAQIVSTRDILSNVWNDWFTGGLNYQIEHHLFPTLPRHNLGKVQKSIMELCHKHGLVYENCGMATGTYRVLQRLADVAAEA
uniref:Fatty acid delta-6-desaturase n=1 Tax=Lobosphaera incisa TaxID=312850 RepID=G9FT51_9CHLO|nr:fatty acid delta-6-desaturase [Lobosphaera incisa]